MIKQLEWKISMTTGNTFAFTLSHRYAIIESDDGYTVKRTDLTTHKSDFYKGFESIELAKEFAEAHRKSKEVANG